MSLAPSATFNVATQAPFSRTTINDILTKECYDSDPSRPWELRFSIRRRALTDGDRALRVDRAKRLLGENHTAAWYRDTVVWVDICSKVIPGTLQKSPGSMASSKNLGGSKTADKQCCWGDTRVFMAVVLARGVLCVKVFTEREGSSLVRHPMGREFW